MSERPEIDMGSNRPLTKTAEQLKKEKQLEIQAIRDLPENVGKKDLQLLQEGTLSTGDLDLTGVMIDPFRERPELRPLDEDVKISPQLFADIEAKRKQLETKKLEGISPEELALRERALTKGAAKGADLVSQRLQQILPQETRDIAGGQALKIGSELGGDVAEWLGQKQYELQTEKFQKQAVAYDELIELSGLEATVENTERIINVNNRIYNDQLNILFDNIDQAQVDSWNQLQFLNKQIETGQAQGALLAGTAYSQDMFKAKIDMNNAVVSGITNVLGKFVEYTTLTDMYKGKTTGEDTTEAFA